MAKKKANTKHTLPQCPARVTRVIRPRREPEEWADLSDQIADLISLKKTDKVQKAMVARALGATVTVLVNYGNQASAELARDIYLAVRKAREMNARKPTALLECGTDLWESEATRRHQMLAVEVGGGPPQLYQVRYSRRHVGVVDIRVESDDAARSCGIRRGDTVYFDVMTPRHHDLRPGDIAGSYWCEPGKEGWQTLIGRIEKRGDRLVAVNDKGVSDPVAENLVRIVAVEKPVGRERAWLDGADEAPPEDNEPRIVLTVGNDALKPFGYLKGDYLNTELAGDLRAGEIAALKIEGRHGMIVGRFGCGPGVAFTITYGEGCEVTESYEPSSSMTLYRVTGRALDFAEEAGDAIPTNPWEELGGEWQKFREGMEGGK